MSEIRDPSTEFAEQAAELGERFAGLFTPTASTALATTTPAHELAPEHVEELVRGSAISRDVLARAGIYSERDPKVLAKLLGKQPKEWADGRTPAWVIPYRIPGQRDPVIFRGKPLKPFEVRERDGATRLQKYAQPPRTGVVIYFGPSLLDERTLNDTSIPLWITEGEKKALSAESHGLSCLAIPGVSQWHVKGQEELHPYFAHIKLEGREVFIAFDYDALTNKDVRREELALGRALERKGALVRIVRLPQDAPKLDDFFVTHEASELAALIQDAREGGKLPPETKGASDNEWSEIWPKLRIDYKTEKPVQDVDNIVRILLDHPAWADALAYDARFERQMFLRDPPFVGELAAKGAKVPRPVVDEDATRVGIWLVSQRVLGWSKAPKTATVEQAIGVVCQHKRFDAVQRYLAGLKWDGTPRLDDAAHVYFGAEPTPYHRAVVAKWMLSAVARARTPGCQADHVLVLEGAQGKFKSTALRVLAGDEFFSDTLPDITTKDAHEFCVGPWIIELAELDHVRKSEVTAFKAFVTARAPRFRAAYGRRAAEHPRRCVFAGTSNEDSYLNDPTGGRRFWPVKIGVIAIERLRADRDQLWAEAVHRVRAGESTWLDTEELAAAAAEQQRSRRTVDPWQPRVEAYLGGRKHTTVGELLSHLGVDIDRQDQRASNRASAALRDAGWVRRKASVGGVRVWRYEPGDAVPVVPVNDFVSDEVGRPQVIDFPSKVPVGPVVSVVSIEGENKREGEEYWAYDARDAHAIAHERFSASQEDTGTPGQLGQLFEITDEIPDPVDQAETGTPGHDQDEEGDLW